MSIRNKLRLLVFLTLIYKVSCQSSRLTFVIDETLSMEDDIGQVRNAVSSIMDIILKEKRQQIKNMSLVTFNDKEAKLRSTTHSPKELIAKLTRITPGNNDYNYECPEMALSGIKLAIESSLPESYIFVFTDASAKDYRKSREIQQLCEKKQIQVVFVLTGDCNRPSRNPFQVYYDIATDSSGLAFRIEKNEVEAVYRAISEIIKDTKVVLAAVTLADNQTEVPFQVGEEIEYAIVSASGINVSLEINVPPEKMEKIMWTKHGKVVKLLDSGKYVATVKSINATSVVIAGWSNFYFRYGFSEQYPESLEDTELEPILDTSMHLSLLVTDPKYSLDIPSAQILDLQHNVIKELPLKEIQSNFYITAEPFVVPAATFKIAMVGENAQTGNPVRRIAKIYVTAQKSGTLKPYGVLHHVNILKGDSKILKTNLPRTGSSSVNWFLNGEDMQLPDPYLSIDTATESDDGNYTCHVSDIHGSATETFVVDVGYPPTFKPSPQGSVVEWSGDPEDDLICDAIAKPPGNVEWTFNGETVFGERSTNLLISQSGHYKCNVSNVHGAIQREFEVKRIDS